MFKKNFILLNNYNNDNCQFSSYDSLNYKDINEIIRKLIIILLLIFNANLLNNFHLFLDEYKDNNIRNNLKLNIHESVMGNHSLYKLYKYEQISLLISGVNNWKINDTSLLIFINSLRQQTLKEIQIIFILRDEKENQIVNSIKKYIKGDNKIKLFSASESIELDNYYLMDLIRGKFIMIIEKFIILEKKDLENFFLSTNGKIDNIFEKRIQNNTFYLIKTKVIRNLIDKGQIFNNSHNLIKNIILLQKPQLNYISIAICPNNYYVPLTYVSMISILSSKEEFTFISFYLVISKDFNKKNINLFLSLYEQFDYLNITFFEMDDRYKNAFISRRMTIQTYFRFSLGEIFPHLNRILYLDSDIIVYKDLNKLYNLNFNGKMVLGQVTTCNRSKKTGIYHINNGILLFNLIQMRKLKIEEKVLKIIKKREKFI